MKAKQESLHTDLLYPADALEVMLLKVPITFVGENLNDPNSWSGPGKGEKETKDFVILHLFSKASSIDLAEKCYHSNTKS